MIVPLLELAGGIPVAHKPDGSELRLPQEDPISLAKALYRYGEITVIDVDAATGQGDHSLVITEICRAVDCRVGGGIRDAKRADTFLRAGAKRIIVGSGADEEFLRYFPRSKVVIGIDMRGGKVMRDGWQTETDIDPLELADRNRMRCGGFLINVVGDTDAIDPDDLSRFRTLRDNFPKHHFTTNIGSADPDSIRELDRAGVDCQVGMASIEQLPDAFIGLIDFEKGGGLVPVVVVDPTGQVLSLVHANADAVRKSVTSGQATYWSRARGELWTKGATSGHTQSVSNIKIDCDRDALIFTVDPIGNACHLDRYSCFDDMDFSVNRLAQVLESRFSKGSTGSYTNLMLSNKEAITERIVEEAQSLSKAGDRSQVVFETADLLYFMLLNLVREKITLDEVVKELRGRAGRRRSQ